MYCVECGRRIYQGDTYYEINTAPVCEECAREYLDEYCREFGDDGEEMYVVDDMGYDIEDVDVILRGCAKVLEYDDEEEEGDPRDEPEYWLDR